MNTKKNDWIAVCVDCNCKRLQMGTKAESENLIYKLTNIPHSEYNHLQIHVTIDYRNHIYSFCYQRKDMKTNA